MPALPMLPELNAAINFTNKKNTLFKADDWKFIQDSYCSIKLLAKNREYLHASLEQLNSKLEQLFQFFGECGVHFTEEDKATYRADFLAGRAFQGTKNKEIKEKAYHLNHKKGGARPYVQLKSELNFARARFANAYDYYLGVFEFLVESREQDITPDIKEELKQQTQAERPFVYYHSAALIKTFDILDKVAAILDKQRKSFDKLQSKKRDKDAEYGKFLADLETWHETVYSALVREATERLKLSIEKQDLTFDDTVEGYLSQRKFKSVDLANRALLLRKKAFLVKLPADKEKKFSGQENSVFTQLYKTRERLEAAQTDAESLSLVGLLPTQKHEARTVSQTFELARLIQTNQARKALDKLDQAAKNIVSDFLKSRGSDNSLKISANKTIFVPSAVTKAVTEMPNGPSRIISRKNESYWLTRALSPFVQRYYTEFGFAKAMVPANRSLEKMSAFGVNFKNHIQCIEAAEMTLADMEKVAGSLKNKIRRGLSNLIKGSFSKLCKEYDDFIAGQKREIAELRKDLADHIAKNIDHVLTDAQYRNNQNNRPNISRGDLQELKRYVSKYKSTEQSDSNNKFNDSISFVKRFLDRLKNTNLSLKAQNRNSREDYVTIVNGRKVVDDQKLRVDINNILHFYPHDPKLVEVLNLLRDILISDDYPLISTQNENETKERYSALVSQVAYLYTLQEHEEKNGWSLNFQQNSKIKNSKINKKSKPASNQNNSPAIELLKNIATDIIAVQGKQYSYKGASFYQGLVTDSHMLDEKRQSAGSALGGIQRYYNSLFQSFALIKFTADEVSRLKELIGTSFQKINKLNLKSDHYKNIFFTEDEISAIKQKLANIHTEEAENLTKKLVSNCNTLEEAYEPLAMLVKLQISDTTWNKRLLENLYSDPNKIKEFVAFIHQELSTISSLSDEQVNRLVFIARFIKLESPQDCYLLQAFKCKILSLLLNSNSETAHLINKLFSLDEGIVNRVYNAKWAHVLTATTNLELVSIKSKINLSDEISKRIDGLTLAGNDFTIMQATIQRLYHCIDGLQDEPRYPITKLVKYKLAKKLYEKIILLLLETANNEQAQSNFANLNATLDELRQFLLVSNEARISYKPEAFVPNNSETIEITDIDHLQFEDSSYLEWQNLDSEQVCQAIPHIAIEKETPVLAILTEYVFNPDILFNVATRYLAYYMRLPILQIDNRNQKYESDKAHLAKMASAIQDLFKASGQHEAEIIAAINVGNATSTKHLELINLFTNEKVLLAAYYQNLKNLLNNFDQFADCEEQFKQLYEKLLALRSVVSLNSEQAKELTEIIKKQNLRGKSDYFNFINTYINNPSIKRVAKAKYLLDSMGGLGLNGKNKKSDIITTLGISDLEELKINSAVKQISQQATEDLYIQFLPKSLRDKIDEERFAPTIEDLESLLLMDNPNLTPDQKNCLYFYCILRHHVYNKINARTDSPGEMYIPSKNELNYILAYYPLDLKQATCSALLNNILSYHQLSSTYFNNALDYIEQFVRANNSLREVDVNSLVEYINNLSLLVEERVADLATQTVYQEPRVDMPYLLQLCQAIKTANNPNLTSALLIKIFKTMEVMPDGFESDEFWSALNEIIGTFKAPLLDEIQDQHASKSKFCTLFDTWSYNSDKEINDRLKQFYTKEMGEIYDRVRKVNKDNSAICKLFERYGGGSIKGWAASDSGLKARHKTIKDSIASCDISANNDNKAVILSLNLGTLLNHEAPGETKIKTLDALLEHLQAQTAKLKKNEGYDDSSILQGDLNEFLYTANNIWLVLNQYFPEHSKIDYENIEKLAKQYGELPEYLQSSSSIQHPMSHYEALLNPGITASAVTAKSSQEAHLSFRKNIAEEIRYLHFEVVSSITNFSVQLTEAEFNKVLEQKTEGLRGKLLEHFDKKNKEKTIESNSKRWSVKADKLNEYLDYLKEGVKEYHQYLEAEYKVEIGHEYRGRITAICSKAMPVILATIVKLNGQDLLNDEVTKLCKLVKGILEFEQKAFKQELSEADAKVFQDDFYATQLTKLLVTHPQLFTGNMDESIEVIGQLARLLVSEISESRADIDARANKIQAQVIDGSRDSFISEKIDLGAVDSSTYSFGFEIKLLMLADKFKYADEEEEFQARCSETLKVYLTNGLKKIDDPRLKAKFFAKLYSSLGNNLVEQGYDKTSGVQFLKSFRSAFYGYITQLPTEDGKQITALIMMLNELNSASTLELMKQKQLFNDFRNYFERTIKAYFDRCIAQGQNFNELKDLLKLLSPSFKAINLFETGRANLFNNPWIVGLSEQGYLENLEALFSIYIEHVGADDASHMFVRNIKNSWYSYLGYKLQGTEYINSLSTDDFNKRLAALAMLVENQSASLSSNIQANVAIIVINLYQALLEATSLPALKINIIKHFAGYIQVLENRHVPYDRIIVLDLIRHAFNLIDPSNSLTVHILDNGDTVKQCMQKLQHWANLPKWNSEQNRLEFAISLYHTIKEDSPAINFPEVIDGLSIDTLSNDGSVGQEIVNDILYTIVNLVNSSHGIEPNLLNMLKQNKMAHALDILSAIIREINSEILNEQSDSNTANERVERIVCYTNMITEVLSHGVDINDLDDMYKLYKDYKNLINHITSIIGNLPTQQSGELKYQVIECQEKLLTAYAKKLVLLSNNSNDINNLITYFFGPPLTQRMLSASEEKILEQVLKQFGEQASIRKKFVADLTLRLVNIASSESTSPDQEKSEIAKQLFIYSNIYLAKPLARDSQYENQFKQALVNYFKSFITDKSLMNDTAYSAIIENYEKIIANLGSDSQNLTSYLSIWVKQAVQTVLKQHYAELEAKAKESRSNANLTRFLQFWFANKEIIEFSGLPKVSEFVDNVLQYCTDAINQNDETLSEGSSIRDFIDRLLSSDGESIISGPRLSRRMSITSITSTDSQQSFTDTLPKAAAVEQSAPNTPSPKNTNRTVSLFGWRTSSAEGKKSAGSSSSCVTKSVTGSPTDETASHAASFQFSDTRWLLLVVSGEYRRLCESVNNHLIDYFKQINMSDNKQPISFSENVNILFSKILKRENCGSNYPGLMLNLQLLKVNKALDKFKDDQYQTNDADLAVLKEAFCNLYFYLIENPNVSVEMQELVLKNLTELANKIADAQEKMLKRSSSSWFSRSNSSYIKASSSLVSIGLNGYIAELSSFCKLSAVMRTAWLFTQLQSLDEIQDPATSPKAKNQSILDGAMLKKGYQIALTSHLNRLNGLKLVDILQVFPLNYGTNSIRENETIISNYLHHLEFLRFIHTGLNKRETGDNDNITTIKQLFNCLNSLYKAMEALAKINKDTDANRIMDGAESAWKNLNQAIANINSAEGNSEENPNIMPEDFSNFMQSLYTTYCEKLEASKQASSQVATEAVSSRRSSLGSSSS